jgi:DNA primase
MIDNASIETLKSTIDIVDVIGSYIELKKSGANFKACCPFHGEKTASFVVSPSKQIYHCFGCGVGGDSIKFVMEYEKLSYPEAIEKLASNYNFTLHYTHSSSDHNDAKRVLENINKWYGANLLKEPKALNYLKERDISQDSIETFEVGYASSSPQVIAYLNSLSTPPATAIEAGVLASGDNGIYARLVERVIFPIYSGSGSIVGFGGRTLGDHPAKYINSPQTKLFNKSQLLYGYHQAKEHIYKHKKIIITEGYIDVIMLHQGGFKEAVATLGTALTSEHLPLLRKGDPKVILAYDGDSAGVNAALKAATMLSSAGFDGGVVLFPDGQDPADMIANKKSAEVAELFRKSQPFVNFVLEKIINEYELSDPKAKEEAFVACKEYLFGLSEIMRDSYIPLASSMLGVAPSLFSKGMARSEAREKLSRKVEDTSSQQILKTLLENPEYVDDVLDVVDPSMFGSYKAHFDALIKGEFENPLLRSILIDEGIQLLTIDTLKKELRQNMIVFYEGTLKRVYKNDNIPYEKKKIIVRKIKSDILPKLRRGEFVAYEGISAL